MSLQTFAQIPPLKHYFCVDISKLNVALQDTISISDFSQKPLYFGISTESMVNATLKIWNYETGASKTVKAIHTIMENCP